MKFAMPLVIATAVSFSTGAALAADGPQLMKDKACLACHAVDTKLVGPAYKEVAAKYKARKDAEAYLTKKIREGSKGVWGAVPMPPNGTVSDGEAMTLAKYILTLK